jgi:hypothetical protein
VAVLISSLLAAAAGVEEVAAVVALAALAGCFWAVAMTGADKRSARARVRGERKNLFILEKTS